MNEMDMELDDALAVLTEIATGDEERKAICLVKDSLYGLRREADAYRGLYESAQKRLTRFREGAAN